MHLEAADLTGAHLEGADLQDAHLGTVLWEARTRNGAVLQVSAGLAQEQLAGAIGDAMTKVANGLLLGEVAGFPQVGTQEVGVLEVGALQVGAPKIGVLQLSALEPGALRSTLCK